MNTQFLAALAAAGLVTTGVAATATRSASALPSAPLVLAQGAAAAGGSCQVKVNRSGSAGDAKVTRAELPGGGCVCNVSAGPEGSNSAADAVVNALKSTGECNGAPAAETPGGNSGGGGGGGGTGVVAAVVGAVAAGGLAVGLGSKSPG